MASKADKLSLFEQVSAKSRIQSRRSKRQAQADALQQDLPPEERNVIDSRRNNTKPASKKTSNAGANDGSIIPSVVSSIPESLSPPVSPPSSKAAAKSANVDKKSPEPASLTSAPSSVGGVGLLSDVYGFVFSER